MGDKKVDKGKKGKNLFIIILALAILGVISFGGIYFWMKSKDQNSEKPVIQAYQDLGEIMVNLDNDKRSRYVKVNLSLGYDSKNKEAVKILENNVVVLRDSAIFYFKSKKSEDFKAGNEESLKAGLIENLNKSLEEPVVLDVYMNDIIVQ